MSRTIKEATAEQFHYDRQDQLRSDLVEFIAPANSFAVRRTFGGLKAHEYICKASAQEPNQCIVQPIYHGPGCNEWTQSPFAED